MGEASVGKHSSIDARISDIDRRNDLSKAALKQCGIIIIDISGHLLHTSTSISTVNHFKIYTV